MSQINKPSDYFNTKLYTGNGTADHAITGVGFQPDWVWYKGRNDTEDPKIFDAVRGATKAMKPNGTDAEFTQSGVTSFDSDGFTLGTHTGGNENNINFVSWNWLAGGTASSNTDGSITSSVSANTTSGFSIVSYTGNGTGSATFGHGLGSTPKIVIIKRRDVAEGWQFWYDNTVRLQLNSTGADLGNFPISTSSTLVTTPSTVDTAWNASSATYISYCFAEKKGFSKFGSYTGNGSTDGTFVYTGFKPAFVLIKAYSGGTYFWCLLDNKRGSYNVNDKSLFPNSSNAEATSISCDFLSNGFKWRSVQTSENASATSYIYMAFAEQPLVGTNNIPATAR